MESDVQTELAALLKVILGLRPPEPGEESLQIALPESLAFLGSEWRQNWMKATQQQMLATFELRRKTPADDPSEIEAWKNQSQVEPGLERRKNHRLHIRSTVDDLFEKNRPVPDVLTCVRAWKLQVADRCADAVLQRFHLRPTAGAPWVRHRQKVEAITRYIEETLAHGSLFLMGGRFPDVKAMEFAIKKAYQATQDLLEALEADDSPGDE
ncbi:MAG: hypothetical protein ACOYZ7_17290 [Chloroflexota bacterium]